MNKNTKLAVNLFALAAGMLMLAYASVPLYNLFCKVTGYGGTTQEASSAPAQISSRIITVEFNADIDPHLKWKFAPGEHSRKIKIGERGLTFYTAENLDSKNITGQAVYNVTPFKAGQYFSKLECFCFSEQTLKAGEKVNMPVSFFLDPELLNDPEMDDIKTITLSYTFFPANK